ncbi:MAG: ParB N-terminal domain-containing protein [Planctomycetota bacterium]|jgi:ParB-like chromosome segregation protein Spo0J
MLKIKEMKTSDLKPWDGNPRSNDGAVEAVGRSISTFGFNVPIICDQDLTIVAGHTRWKAARKLGMKSVPVIVLHMTDAQRKAFSIADNKTAEIATWDFPKLRDILEELRSEDISLPDIGFSETELAALLEPGEEPDWSEFDKRLARLEDDVYVLLPVKVRPEARGPLHASIKARAAELGVEGKEVGVLAGKVIQKLLGVEP